MNSMKKRILSALCAAMLLLSTAACGGKTDDNAGANNGASNGTSADVSEPSAPSALSKDDYIAKVLGLEDAALEFTQATASLFSSALSAEDAEAVREPIENIRATKQSFLDFAAIDNPAEGYEDAHTELAQNCSDFAGLVDEYCDVMLAMISGEETGDTDELQTRMETVITAMGTSIEAIQAIE